MAKVTVPLPDDVLAQPHAEDMAAAIERSERRFRNAGSFESADLVRVDRDDCR